MSWKKDGERRTERDGTTPQSTRREYLGGVGGVAFGGFASREDLVEFGNGTRPATAATSSLPPDSPIGGGDTYDDTFTSADATVVVSTLGELDSALASAGSGDVVFVDGDATIDASSVTGTGELRIPSGVTLASNRGVDGAPGGRIKTDTIDYEAVLHAEGGARVTGIRINGPEWEWRDYSTPVVSGVVVEGPNCEFDNVEMWGFNHAAIKLGHSAHVHHSHVHHNPMSGLGYGIMCNGDDDGTLVEYNHFVFNRHCVANNGNAGYEVRYNYFGGEETPSYQVGTHGPGGTTLSIHHNTFVPTLHMGQHGPNDPDSHVTIRGVPDGVADIHHNWFYNPKEPMAPPPEKDRAVLQIDDLDNWDHATEWRNVTFSNNHYGSDEPDDPDVGAPVGDGGGGGTPQGAYEDFERSSPLAEYGGADGLYGVTTSTVYEGTQALINDSGSYGSAVSTAGLGTYPSRGDEVVYRFSNAADDNFVAFHLFAQSETDSPDGYSVGISNSGAWRMWVQENGSLSRIASEDLPTADQIDGWYRAEVWTDDTTVYADLYDDATDDLLASIQADDATFSAGGIGFRSAGNGEVWDYATRTAVEDFERSSPLAEYGGADGLYGVTTSTVYEGDQALINDSGSYGSAVSTSGLDRYPSRGDEVVYRFSNAADDNFVGFHLFAQSESDSPDGYSVGISNSGAWRMWVQEGGSLSRIASQDLPSADQIDGWYRAEVRTDSTTVYADLYDDANDDLLASIQADDATFSAGGIGFRSAGNGEVWDDVR